MAPPGDRSPLVGRDAELAAARRLLDAARAGSGGGLLVRGEAGVGKSRLIAELTEAAAGMVVLSGRAVPGGATYRAVASALLGRAFPPALADSAQLSPFRTALSAVLPGWGAEPSPAERGGPDPVLVLAEGLRRLLAADAVAAGAAGTVLVLEDLHWADADTLALVDYLAAAARGSALLVVGSVRDEELPATRTLPGGVAEIRLGRLDPAAVAELAAAITGAPPDETVQGVIARAEGLPALVEELLAGRDEDLRRPDRVPPTMADLVGARLTSLPEPAAAVVQAAAVLGTEPDWTLLAPMTGVDVATVLAALRSAAEAGLLWPDPQRLRWRHALTRDAVLATLVAPERAHLARRAADALADGGDDALRAELLVAAGDTAQAAALLQRLARADVDRGTLRSAQDRLDLAAAVGAHPREIAADRVRVRALRGQVVEALDVGTAALAEVTGTAHADLCRQLARTAVAGGRWADADRYLARAGRPDEPASAVIAAEAAFGQGRPQRARELATAAADGAEQAAEPDVLCDALVVSGRCAALTDLDESARLFARAAQLAAEHGFVQQRVEALIGVGTGELMQANRSPALDEARKLAQASGMFTHALSIDVIRCEVAFTVDGPCAVEPAASDIADRAGRLGLLGLQGLAETLMAVPAAADGDLAAMTTVLDRALARPHASPEVAAMADAVRALPHLLAGDLTRGARLLDPAMTGLAGHASAAPLAFWGVWALLQSVVADGGTARDVLRAAPARLRATNAGALAYADAVAAGRAGRAADAVRLLAAGDDLLATSPWWHRLLRLTALGAAVRDGWGDPVPLLRADLAVFEQREE
ncbi:MAG TPA: ATP-binding protein, partial [Jatrophihabitantaceae bacterium]